MHGIVWKFHHLSYLVSSTFWSSDPNGQMGSPKRYAYTQSCDLLASDDGTETVYPPLSSEKPFGSYNYEEWDSSDEYHEVMSHRKLPPTVQGQQGHCSGATGGSGGRSSVPAKKYRSFVSPSHSLNSHADDFRDVERDLSNHAYNQIRTSRDLETNGDFHDPWQNGLPEGQVDLSTSVEILATAERLINHNQWSASQKDVQAYSSNSNRMRAKLAGAAAAEAGESLFFYDNHFSQSAEQGGLKSSDTSVFQFGASMCCSTLVLLLASSACHCCLLAESRML